MEGINIDVKQKDLIALIGPNGAGKINPSKSYSRSYQTDKWFSHIIWVQRLKQNLKYVGYVPQSAKQETLTYLSCL